MQNLHAIAVSFALSNNFQVFSGSYLKFPVALKKARAAKNTKYLKGGETFKMLLITQKQEKPFKERCDTESKDLKYNQSSRENPAIENAEGLDT